MSSWWINKFHTGQLQQTAAIYRRLKRYNVHQNILFHYSFGYQFIKCRFQSVNKVTYSIVYIILSLPENTELRHLWITLAVTETHCSSAGHVPSFVFFSWDTLPRYSFPRPNLFGQQAWHFSYVVEYINYIQWLLNLPYYALNSKCVSFFQVATVVVLIGNHYMLAGEGQRQQPNCHDRAAARY